MTAEHPAPTDDTAAAPVPDGEALPTAQQLAGAGQPPLPPVVPRTNTLAVIALVSSFFVGLAGIVCGAISLSQLKRTGERGRGLAIAGIVVGALQTIASVTVALVLVAAAAVVGVSSAASQAVDELPSISKLDAAAECADLSARLNEGSAALREASANATSDPKAALDALTSFSAELRAAAAKVDDDELAAAVNDAATEVDDLAAVLQPLLASPGAAGPDATDALLDHLKKVTTALASLQATCATTE